MSYLTCQGKEGGFQDTALSKKSPRKPHGRCGSWFIVILRGAAGRIIDAPITLHDSGVEKAGQE